MRPGLRGGSPQPCSYWAGWTPQATSSLPWRVAWGPFSDWDLQGPVLQGPTCKTTGGPFQIPCFGLGPDKDRPAGLSAGVRRCDPGSKVTPTLRTGKLALTYGLRAAGAGPAKWWRAGRTLEAGGRAVAETTAGHVEYPAREPGAGMACRGAVGA